MSSQRYRLVISYDGTEFAGSQIQPAGRTVAGTLKTELESITGIPVHLVFAGRTDSGVHADGNVCSFEGCLRIPAEKLPEILNARLPADLRIRSADKVDDEFHPRFDAIGRTYRYRLCRAEYVPVDQRRYAVQYHGQWNAPAVQEALRCITGRHCFRNYCKAPAAGDECYCELTVADLVEQEGGSTEFIFSGNRFLRHMICRLAGALLLVAGGRISSGQFRNSVDGEMTFKLRPAPAQGLTLVRVDYPEED